VLLYLTAGENVPQNEAARSNRLLNVMWPEIWQYIFLFLLGNALILQPRLHGSSSGA
jgi:hypothetical protein